MKKLISLAVVSLGLLVSSSALAQAAGTTTDSTDVTVRFRGILELQVDITAVEFDFTQNTVNGTVTDPAGTKNQASIDGFTNLLDVGGKEIFAPSAWTGNGDDGAGTANDFGIARVLAAANPEWTLSAKLDAPFDDNAGGASYGTLSVTTGAQKEKTTASYAYVDDEVVSIVAAGSGVAIATATKDAASGSQAGANGVSEVKLYFGFEVDSANLPLLDNTTDTFDTQTVTYTLVSP